MLKKSQVTNPTDEEIETQFQELVPLIKLENPERFRADHRNLVITGKADALIKIADDLSQGKALTHSIDELFLDRGFPCFQFDPIINQYNLKAAIFQRAVFQKFLDAESAINGDTSQLAEEKLTSYRWIKKSSDRFFSMLLNAPGREEHLNEFGPNRFPEAFGIPMLEPERSEELEKTRTFLRSHNLLQATIECFHSLASSMEGPNAKPDNSFLIHGQILEHGLIPFPGSKTQLNFQTLYVHHQVFTDYRNQVNEKLTSAESELAEKFLRGMERAMKQNALHNDEVEVEATGIPGKSPLGEIDRYLKLAMKHLPDSEIHTILNAVRPQINHLVFEDKHRTPEKLFKQTLILIGDVELSETEIKSLIRERVRSEDILPFQFLAKENPNNTPFLFAYASLLDAFASEHWQKFSDQEKRIVKLFAAEWKDLHTSPYPTKTHYKFGQEHGTIHVGSLYGVPLLNPTHRDSLREVKSYLRRVGRENSAVKLMLAWEGNPVSEVEATEAARELLPFPGKETQWNFRALYFYHDVIRDFVANHPENKKHSELLQKALRDEMNNQADPIDVAEWFHQSKARWAEIESRLKDREHIGGLAPFICDIEHNKKDQKLIEAVKELTSMTLPEIDGENSDFRSFVGRHLRKHKLIPFYDGNQLTHDFTLLLIELFERGQIIKETTPELETSLEWLENAVSEIMFYPKEKTTDSELALSRPSCYPQWFGIPALAPQFGIAIKSIEEWIRRAGKWNVTREALKAIDEHGPEDTTDPKMSEFILTEIRKRGLIPYLSKKSPWNYRALFVHRKILSELVRTSQLSPRQQIIAERLDLGIELEMEWKAVLRDSAMF